MKNAAQPGRTIPLPAPYAVTSGDGLLVGSIFGFASTSAGAGESVETTLVGVFDIKKTASQAWAIGDKVYWDNVAKEATKTSTNNTLIGAAIEPVGNSASETIAPGISAPPGTVCI